MKYQQNLHTHCTYCDGIDSMEAMIQKAIELNFDTLGFSSHAPMQFETDYAIRNEKLLDYCKEIESLKKQYKDKIKILRGLELDYFAEKTNVDFDYLIGSVHVLKIGDEYYDVDDSLETSEMIINEKFGGDSTEYARAYYELLVKLPELFDFDFVGHFDLITKYNDIKPIVDTECKKYKDTAIEALHAVNQKINLFEINSGAISRGYKKMPYPDVFILKELKQIGGKVILTSDCHNKEYLDCNFDLSIELLKNCGFSEVYTIGEKGFVGNKI